jgi:hypothetical protein
VTSFLDQTLTAFLDQAAARQPAPGGGTAAALTVALAYPRPPRTPRPQACAVVVNRVGSEGELVSWGGSHVMNPGGRTVAGAPLCTEELVTADVGLADVARRRHEMPLLGNPRLGLLLQEQGRLTMNREEAGVPGSPARLGS